MLHKMSRVCQNAMSPGHGVRIHFFDHRNVWHQNTVSALESFNFLTLCSTAYCFIVGNARSSLSQTFSALKSSTSHPASVRADVTERCYKTPTPIRNLQPHPHIANFQSHASGQRLCKLFAR